MLIWSLSNIFMAGPSATIVEAKFAFDPSDVNMNSGITNRAAMARSSACNSVTKLDASRPRAGKSSSKPAGASRIVRGPYCEKCRVRPVVPLIAVTSASFATLNPSEPPSVDKAQFEGPPEKIYTTATIGKP